MVDIAEQICKAVDQIVTKKIESINFDTTIIATIEKADQAKQQKYTCSNGSAQFIAFSKDDTYKVGDTVLVTIPNNDYDQQKIIIGKYVAKESKPFNYVAPFDTFIDVSANLIDTTQTNNLGLLANEIIEGQEDVKIIEKLLYSQFSSKGYKGFNRLGLKGQFRSWLAELETISGNYGYRLEILSFMGSLIRDNLNTIEVLTALGDLRKKILLTKQLPNNWETVINKIPEDWFVNKNYQTEDVVNEFKTADSIEEKLSLLLLILSEKLKISNIYLSSNDMYGNPYNFQSYFEQEKVYDISDIGEILGVSLWFYEETGTFKDKQGKLIPYRFDPDDALTRRGDNLFTQDPYICLGYDLSGFNEEQAILYSLDSDSFYIQDDIPEEQNYKTIRLRWLHQFEDDKIQVVNEATKMDKPYEIRWYRFELGKPSADEYSGVYWVREEPTEESVFNFILKPKPNTVNEKVKAIVLYDNKIIESNTLIFESDDPEGASNVSMSKTLAGLSLWCTDESYGNYFVYGQNNEILESDKINQNKELYLQARFADAFTLTETDDVDVKAPYLKEAKSIVWEFPLKNSMIIVDGINYNKDSVGSNPWVQPGKLIDAEVEVNEANNTIKITRLGDVDDNLKIEAEQGYLIQNFYNASAFNNTVKCTIIKNSKVYSATKEFNFGLRGTSGTDVTLVIDFNNNKTALTAEPFENANLETLKLTARLFDSSYNEIDFNNEQYSNLDINWSWFIYNQILPGSYGELDSQKSQCIREYLNIKKEELNSLIAEINEKLNDEGLEQKEKNKLNAEKIKHQAQLNEVLNLIDGLYNNNLTTEQNEILDDYYLPHAQALYGDIQIDSTDKNVCILSQTKTLNLAKNNKDYFQILQCSIKGWGDYEELIAFKAIPIRKDQRFRNIVGPVDIIYDSKGNIYYNKNPYELFGCENFEDIEASTDTVNNGIPTISLDNIKWEIYNPFKERTDLIGSISEKSNDILQPCPLYTKDAKLYGVRAISTDVKSDDFNEVLWQQPLVILQNRYPSATLNSWNGKSVEMNENEGYIIAPAIAAGKKESDNTFSGVMLGDWSQTDTEKSITAQTGLYGFHHGAQSFGFKEDGTAFIGKSGHGRIDFDGNSGIITSSRWLEDEIGMFLDLDDGILKMQKKPRYDEISFTSQSEFDNFKDPLYILKGQYYLIPFGTHFKNNEEKGHNNSFKIIFDGKNITMHCDKIPIYIKYYYNLGLLEQDFYEKNKNELYYMNEGTQTYVKAVSYDANINYYEIRYELQRYNTNESNENWNQNSGDEYYTYYEDYVDAGNSYNAEETYYKLSEDTNDRYITLSADEDSYPLSIGSDSIVSSRKFKVRWDGTCFIEDGKFNGIIEAETGYLGDLELEGYLASNKHSLYDFKRSGFWLDEDGLNIGSKNNYFLATTEYTGFYNNQGALRVTGQGLNLYGFTSPPSTSSNIFETLATSATSAIEIGWKKLDSYGNPYIRLGGGSETSGAMKNAGAIKKFGQGLWIGNYSIEQFSDAGVPDPDSDAEAGIDYYNSGLFVYLGMGGTHHGGKFLRGEVYRYDKDYKAPSSPAEGEQVFPDNFVPIKYAVFA